MDETIRILAVAPYEGLVNLLVDAARSYPDIRLETVVGNLEAGLMAAIDRLVEPFDLILSRGGTADLLRENLDIPVVDIRTSPFDVLQAVRLAEDIRGRRALVGFAGITDAARITNDALQLGLDIFTLVEEDDVHDVLARLSSGGYEIVLCDVISSAVFREAGFGTVLVTSGIDSVRASMDEAVRMSHQLRDMRAENRFLRSVLAAHDDDCVIFAADGRLAFTTLDKGGSTRLVDLLRDLLPQVLAGDADSIRRSIDGQQYRIHSLVSTEEHRTRIAFFITRSRANPHGRLAGIRFLTRQEAREAYLDSPFSLSGEINNHSALIRNTSELGVPLLIDGEYGTGRTAVAHFTYANSARAAHPLVEVDCALLTERSSDFLLNSRNSPVFDAGQTLYLKNLERADRGFIVDMLTTIVTTRMVERNALILAGDLRSEELARMLPALRDELGCTELTLPPLRMSRERIPALARQYLNQLNAGLPKDILGIDRDALQLLSDFSWPGNYTQFARVLQQLCVRSHDHTIRSSEVRELLARERPLEQGAAGILEGAGSALVDLERPLHEIERDIVERTLERNGGNQSAAARQLGISRTTLWRMLRQED